MNRSKYLAKMMSQRQKEIYAIIVAQRKYVARGSVIATCRVLQQLGLIMSDPTANNPNEYILNGKPVALPFDKKLPLPKDVVKEIERIPRAPNADSITQPEQSVSKHKAIVWAQPTAAPTVYSNVNREQHVSRWLNEPVKGKAGKIIPVKCLTWPQMGYIMDHHEQKTASEMADHLGKEKYEVLLFCQANAIEPAQRKRIGYNQQKKTA